MIAIIVLRLLSVHDGDHAVHFRVTFLVLVVHKGKFEIRGILGLLLRVGTVLKLADNIMASVELVVEFVRVDLCAVFVLR